MKRFFNGKIATVIILLATFVLAGVAIFTAIRLYQLRQTSVAPNVPESQPKAAGQPCGGINNLACPAGEKCSCPSEGCSAGGTCVPTENACSLSFTLTANTPTPTPTGSGSPTPTPTGSGTPTPTPTPTPTGTPNSCNGTCGSNSNCNSDLICSGGFCRNPNCTSDTDCVCPGSTPTATPTGSSNPTATPTAPALPQSGTDWPTTLGIGIGILTIIGSLILAL